jgi:hypothetical protein
MSITAMKQALVALEAAHRTRRPELIKQAITTLNAAIEQADEQEAWKTSDTAYRPDSLPLEDFIKHEVDSFDDWSEWVCPDPTQYFMKCCDCGLVHEMQFNVVKYSEGDKCEDFDDPHVQAVFRARRTTPPAISDDPIYIASDGRFYPIPRQRKPLMEDQIDDIWNRYCDEMGEASINDAYDIARAIEAAHGIGEKT